MFRVVALIGLAGYLLAAPLGAQGTDEVPPGFRPPAGMCRIWINGVPANSQPAPTDCSTAIRRRPPNARVIFGDEKPRTPVPVRSLTDDPPRSEPEERKERPRREPPKRDSEPRRAPERREPPQSEPPREPQEVQPLREPRWLEVERSA
ncbi:MAG: hypothetical protein ACREON_14215 [Gemmatimonadaceae bacterium]